MRVCVCVCVCVYVHIFVFVVMCAFVHAGRVVCRCLCVSSVLLYVCVFMWLYTCVIISMCVCVRMFKLSVFVSECVMLAFMCLYEDTCIFVHVRLCV